MKKPQFRIHSLGYILKYNPLHPTANGDGYVPEHRIIVEKSIGRFLNPKKEIVHHIDENVKNNNLSNLMLLTQKEHLRIHCGWKFINGEWWKTCSDCNRFLKVNDNFYKRKTCQMNFVTQCKDCIKKQSKIIQRKYLDAKEKIIICPICANTKNVYRYSGVVTCSRKCASILGGRYGK